jgi:hypothetical protein
MAAITESLSAGDTAIDFGAAEGRVIPLWATPSAQRRLFSKIEKSDTCWLWTGGRTVSGYGRLKVAGTNRRAHRLTYELLVGPVPEGLVLDHLCRNTLCVRPDHLDPVTHRENILRGEGKAAVNAVKAICSRGHLYTPENTYWRPKGGRSCKCCVIEAKRRWRERQRELA